MQFLSCRKQMQTIVNPSLGKSLDSEQILFIKMHSGNISFLIGFLYCLLLLLCIEPVKLRFLSSQTKNEYLHWSYLLYIRSTYFSSCMHILLFINT
jgi:hypothetical protein